jgi:hopanoid biosynthesis associated protein HpnK
VSQATRRVILTADDFGLSEAVNEGVERAHRDGVLTHASLMVAGPAAGDAVRRARRMPGLRVGLHLVVIEGPAVLSPANIPDLVNARGWFPSDQLRLGLRYFFLAHVRRQLAAEIEAQFSTYAATGLKLDHADAHKHMHLHPTVARLMLQTGRRFGLQRIRVPAEPPGVLAACQMRSGIGARLLYAWSNVLRLQAHWAGIKTPDAVFGIARSGHMTEDHLLRLLSHLPDGTSEIYFHPASGGDCLLSELMPNYKHTAELAALLSPQVRRALRTMTNSVAP